MQKQVQCNLQKNLNFLKQSTKCGKIINWSICTFQVVIICFTQASSLVCKNVTLFKYYKLSVKILTF